MPNSEYADSAQARETDRRYQREQPSTTTSGSEAFAAECNARAEVERVASNARVKAAVDRIGVICGYTK